MAAGSTYTPIATITLGSAQSSISFSSFSGYTDLRLVADFSYATNAVNARLRFNSDAASNYSFTYVLGNGTASSSGRGSNVSDIGTGYLATTSQRGLMIIDVMNYSNATTNKSCLIRHNNAGDRVEATVGLWRNTAAITALSLTGNGGNFATGSTFTLYGIAAA
jgi:hypothetical protein